MTSLFVFLSKNKKWLKVDAQELYNFTMWVAQSPAKVKDETVKTIENFLNLIYLILNKSAKATRFLFQLLIARV